MSLGDGPVGEDDSVLTTVTTATTSSSVPKSRKGGKAAAAVTRKTSRTQKSRAKVVEESRFMASQGTEVDLGSSVIMVDPAPPAKRTRRAVSRQEASQPESSMINSQSSSQPARTTRTRGKAKTKPRLSEDQNQLQSELEAAIEESGLIREETPKPARGTKRTSDGMAKVDSSVVMLEHPPEDMQPKKTRRTKKHIAKEAESQPESKEIYKDPQPVPEPVKKPAAKGKKGKKVAKQAPVEPEPEPEPEPELFVPDTQMEDVAEPGSVLETRELPEPPTKTTPVPSNTEPSPAPSTPTPARHSTSVIRKVQTSGRPPTTAPAKEATPTPSPQSSNAENKPPSSRPSAVRPPLASIDHQVVRIPLAAGTPPNLSPSKRSNFVRVTSTISWSPTDIDNVFLASPVKAAYLSSDTNSEESDKENAMMADLDKADLNKVGKDKALLNEMVGKVRKGLSEREKGMSVEQWVRWNAERGEERLRRECEALVTAFEKEGGRALRVLEGIEAL
jgi:hypothetical protein